MASFGSATSLWLDEKGTMYLTSCLKLHIDLYTSIVSRFTNKSIVGKGRNESI